MTVREYLKGIKNTPVRVDIHYTDKDTLGTPYEDSAKLIDYSEAKRVPVFVLDMEFVSSENAKYVASYDSDDNRIFVDGILIVALCHEDKRLIDTGRIYELSDDELERQNDDINVPSSPMKFKDIRSMIAPIIPVAFVTRKDGRIVTEDLFMIAEKVPESFNDYEIISIAAVEREDVPGIPYRTAVLELLY